MFENGAKRSARDVIDLLEREHGIEERVVQTARKDLGIHTWQEDFQGPHYWGHQRPKIKVKTKVRSQ
jgi:hypothetical protein